METVLVKKASDGDGPEMVDSECFYPGQRISECTAPADFRCPYRQFKTTGSRYEAGMPSRIGTFPSIKPTRLSQK